MTALACAACAGVPTQSYPASTEARLALYAEATPCCDDPSTLAFRPLPERGFTEATIDRASQAFEFHSGLSLLAAFELPKVTAPYRLRVKSLFDFEPRGSVEVKNKGALAMYYLTRIKPEFAGDDGGLSPNDAFHHECQRLFPGYVPPA